MFNKFNFKKIFEINYTSDDRRSFFSDNKNIIGVGMKAASHFLRNVGFMEYAILDKHIISIMKEFQHTLQNKMLLDDYSHIDLKIDNQIIVRERNLIRKKR